MAATVYGHLPAAPVFPLQGSVAYAQLVDATPALGSSFAATMAEERTTTGQLWERVAEAAA